MGLCHIICSRNGPMSHNNLFPDGPMSYNNRSRNGPMSYNMFP